MQATYNLAGIETRIHSDSIDLTRMRVPSLVGLDSGMVQIDHADLIHHDGDRVVCIEREDHLEFVAPAKRYDRCGTIFYLAELAAEQKRELHGGAMLHAAGVYLPGSERGILILGEKGSGKTSTAIGLCKGAEGQLVGNDQVVLASSDKSVQLLDGSKDIHIRRTAAIQDPTLLSLVTFTDNEQPNWDNKITVSPEQAGIKEAQFAPQITDVVQVTIDRTLEETTVLHKRRDTQTLLFITEKISRHIRGVATPIMNNDGVFEAFSPSLDTSETAASRQALIHTILGIGVTKVYAPSTDAMIEAITSNHD
jgi:hypothetical protein